MLVQLRTTHKHADGSAPLCYCMPDETPRRHRPSNVATVRRQYPITSQRDRKITHRGPANRQLSSFAFSRVRQPPSLGWTRQAPGLS